MLVLCLNSVCTRNFIDDEVLLMRYDASSHQLMQTRLTVIKNRLGFTFKTKTVVVVASFRSEASRY